MFARRLITDRWQGISNTEEVVEDPDIVQFEQALIRMDALTYTMVTLRGDRSAHLTIGGGAGRYVVYATFDNNVFWNLLHPEEVVGTVMLNAGGQEGDFPARQVVGKEQAWRAGMSFLKSGQLEQSLRWERQV